MTSHTVCRLSVSVRPGTGRGGKSIGRGHRASIYVGGPDPPPGSRRHRLLASGSDILSRTPPETPMFRLALLSLILAAGSLHAQPGTHQVKLNGHTFTLPEGFDIELVAGPPQVERPIVAAFDERGRLYVCDSSGSNEKVTEQVEKKPHRIV